MADPGSADPKLPIGSGRAQCGACGCYFGSVAGFDMHRQEGRCLTPTEMLGRGMAVNDKGYWVTRLYDPAAHAGAR